MCVFTDIGNDKNKKHDAIYISATNQASVHGTFP